MGPASTSSTHSPAPGTAMSLMSSPGHEQVEAFSCAPHPPPAQGRHAQRLLDQPAQRGLTRAFGVRLPELRQHDVEQRHAQPNAERTAQVACEDCPGGLNAAGRSAPGDVPVTPSAEDADVPSAEGWSAHGGQGRYVQRPQSRPPWRAVLIACVAVTVVAAASASSSFVPLVTSETSLTSVAPRGQAPATVMRSPCEHGPGRSRLPP